MIGELITGVFWGVVFPFAMLLEWYWGQTTDQPAAVVADRALYGACVVVFAAAVWLGL
ncbi:hypothetical protein [Enhygromyxa salina]|nr:hypothetical protein [Enhygromyxa salina]